MPLATRERNSLVVRVPTRRMSSSSEEQILNINNIHELSDLPCAGVVDVAQLADRSYSDQNWEIHAGSLRRF